jgi:hypothetical protein
MWWVRVPAAANTTSPAVSDTTKTQDVIASVDMTSVVKPWQQRFLRYHPSFLLVIGRDGASNDDGGSR